jgi:predicted esterase
MKKIILIPVLAIFIWQFPVNGQKKKYDFSTYKDMRAEVGRLYGEKKFNELTNLLEWGLEKFPDHLHANSFNLSITYIQLKQPGKAILVMEKAVKKGVWFGKYTFENEIFTPLKSEKKFQKLLKKNLELLEAAQKKSKPELKVITPVNFQTEKKYPLFIALHGGGENLEQFMPLWTSKKLKEEFIVAYPQSSQLVDMYGFSWTEDMTLSLKEIQTAYNKVITDYPVDQNRIYVGGFSSGGVAALEVVLKNTLPVRGFVALCPAKPEPFDPEDVSAARDRGIRGTIITTEMDNRIEQQKEVINIFSQQGLQYQFAVTPNIGHWYPKDLGERIDQALLHIDNR